jgi:hypothetical protein
MKGELMLINKSSISKIKMEHRGTKLKFSQNVINMEPSVPSLKEPVALDITFNDTYEIDQFIYMLTEFKRELLNNHMDNWIPEHGKPYDK